VPCALTGDPASFAPVSTAILKPENGGRMVLLGQEQLGPGGAREVRTALRPVQARPGQRAPGGASWAQVRTEVGEPAQPRLREREPAVLPQQAGPVMPSVIATPGRPAKWS
jgi:hypothetical protein